MTEKKALGRGLAALIPQSAVEKEDIALPAKDSGAEKWLYKGKEVVYILVNDIRPNRFQPRKEFRNDKLKELTESIRQKGVLQPILVRQLAEDNFELVAGERRWRAAKALGLDRIPAIVKETRDSDALEISLIENLQRDDLNPLEEAKAYKRLADEFALDAEKIAQVVGKASSSVSNMLRLLTLSDKVQQAISAGLITTGHAKAILALKDVRLQERLCRRIIKGNLSVREAERISSGAKSGSSARETFKKDLQISALEEGLQKALGTKVRILPNKRGGKIVIEYFSNNDLERVVDIIGSSLRTK
jgi:ParB family chromosome partitioning protein